MVSDTAKGEGLLEFLLANATVAEPSDEHVVESGKVPVFTNYEMVPIGEKSRRQGLLVGEIRNNLFELTSGWPKRVSDTLFVVGPDHQPLYLDSPTSLFAWLDDLALVDWSRGSDCITQERFYANLQRSAEVYDALETVPHFPPMPSTYYMHAALPEASGGYLDQFVDFFSPLTDADRQLLKAFVVSLLWGGEPGSRPAWLFTAEEHDPEQGRGIGKSKNIELASELCGSFIEVSATEDIAKIKTRLLSPEARRLRVARIDNIKTTRFSWADIEGLITSPVISGHRMYHGEGRRPNLITWALTLNGASLSKDMAQRCVIVKLKRPQHSPTWEQDVRNFVREHRWNIIADIGQVLSH